MKTQLQLLPCLEIFVFLASWVTGEEIAREPLSPPEEFQTFNCDFQGQFPYWAYLRDEFGGFRCGAVVIQRNAVLTAASCVDPNLHLNIGVSKVFLGGLFQNEPIERRAVAIAIPHQNFNGNPGDGSDLAIVKFVGETCVNPVPNIGQETTHGDEYTILGFGRPAPDDPTEELLGGNVTNIDFMICNDQFGLSTVVDGQRLCTQTPACGCASICDGDEGGPLLDVGPIFASEDTTTLVGIMSYSTLDCEQEGGVGIHTNILPFLNWIYVTLESAEFLNA